MKTIGCRKPILAALATLFASAAIAGCSANNGDDQVAKADKKDGRVGQVGAELMLGTVQVDDVMWTLKNTNATPPVGWTGDRTGTFHVAGPGSTFTGLITGVPSGSGYDLTFAATAVGGGYTCAGHAAPTPFSVAANQTTLQTVHLSCQSNATQNGKILVNGELNACPTADDITASASSAAVGGTISLTAVATDPDSAPHPLAYTFSLSTMQPTMPGAGVLTNANTAAATFMCNSPGPVSVDMTVTDGDAACSVAAAQIILICTGTDACAGITCPATACTNAGTCDHTNGTCSAGTPKAMGTSCANTTTCDGAETCDGHGVCAAGAPLLCNMPPVCQTGGSCSEPGGCGYTNAANGSTCPGGSCQNGVCANLCNPNPCMSSNMCQTAGACNPADGSCGTPTNAMNGATCNDGVSSTLVDGCVGGVCTGNTYACNPGFSCCGCESTDTGHPNTQCTAASNLAAALVGSTTAAAPIGAGHAFYPELYRAVLDCFHTSGCAGATGVNATDCFCGIGADPNTCFSGSLANATGPCKTEVMNGLDAATVADVSNRFTDTTYPTGVAQQISRTCDRTDCASSCLGGGKQ